MSTFGFDEAVLGTFVTHASIVLLKTIGMSMLTVKARFSTKTFANEEDAKARQGKVGSNEAVERVRRAHLNDIENVFAFGMIGLCYCYSGPSLSVAAWVFRTFTAARLLHTIFYVCETRQPARGLSFGVAWAVNAYMAVTVIARVAKF